MKKLLYAFNIILICFCSKTYASVVDFESGLDSVFTYVGVNTRSGNAGTNTGYNSVVALTGSQSHAFNSGGQSPTSYSWNGPGNTFDLTSFVFAGAWGSQTFTFQGFLNGVLTETLSFAATTTASIVNLSWSGIDQLTILTGTDFIQTASGGGGLHYAIDNITYNENVSAVPIPAAIWLMGSGLLGLLRFSRKKVQTVAT